MSFQHLRWGGGHAQLFLGLAFLVAGFSGSKGAEPHRGLSDPTEELLQVLCFRAETPIVIDGDPKDAAWERASALQLTDAVRGEPGRFATMVRILYDRDYLYLLFTCEDDYAWGTVSDRDGPIWDEECVEVFVNPGEAHHQYYEINVSPKNVIYDSVILNNRTPARPDAEFIGFPRWDAAGLKTGVAVEGNLDEPGGVAGWNAELAIPHSVLFGAANNPPRPGDFWRINFYRIDTPDNGVREHYAWSATGRNAFHLPWRFGVLAFQ